MLPVDITKIRALYGRFFTNARKYRRVPIYTGDMGTLGGWLGCQQPLVTKIPPHMVQNLYSERELSIKLLLGEKTRKKLTFHHFRLHIHT